MQKTTRIMAIETSAQIGSVALAEGPQMLCRQGFTANLRHASELLVTMDQLTRGQGWKPGDIEQLYISAGPGSFTGLRIAVTCAKAMAYAQGTMIVAVPSTDVLVLNAENESAQVRYVGVVIDAKRKGIYAAVYERSEGGKEISDDIINSYVPGFRCLRVPAVLTAEELMHRVKRPIYLLGDGLRFWGEKLRGKDVDGLEEDYWQPDAANLLRCGWLRARADLFTEADRLVPFYLRRPEAVERWEKIHGKDA